ncbi:hypothetical protein [Candidatus Nanohalobium constans]|uniref:Uncharacterized protein n=1 Tax=Candidatus Nanohalobium constans TaxID=2565781 RepID=A0A5Q0UF89_9ARCH|nr:hypothetical protein [Candidatus Nanohalobium constans]QGA80237.1 hypothetical protein LC1Nh_0336 [Candidatus Nanohalobium constans]
MSHIDGKYLLPVASLLEIAGILTLITNEGMLIPKVDLGFSVPALVPADVQGMLLLIAGGLTMLFAVKNMKE